MVRNVDHTTRKRAILSAVINRYIHEAEPVASDMIAREFELSSATIRNIFSELEKEGYITHPYTSGGKIPTNKGYRYYVDFLVAQMEVLDQEKEKIIGVYQARIERMDDILEKTSSVISKITHYAGIVSFLEWQDRFFYQGLSQVLDQPEFRDFEKIRLVMKMVEEKERLLDIINRDFSGKSRVYIGEELGCPEMEGCALIVSGYRQKDRPMGRLAVLGPKRMEYRHSIPTLEYISDILSEALDNF